MSVDDGFSEVGEVMLRGRGGMVQLFCPWVE